MKIALCILAVFVVGCQPQRPMNTSAASQKTVAEQKARASSTDNKAIASIRIEVSASGAIIEVDNRMVRATTQRATVHSSQQSSSEATSAPHTTPASTRAAYVLVIGGALIAGVGVAVLVWLHLKALGIGLIATGAAVAAFALAVDFIGELLRSHGLLVFLTTIGAAAVATVAWLAWRSRRQETGFDQVRRQVDALPKSEHEAFRKELKKRAGKALPIVRRMVERSKARDDRIRIKQVNGRGRPVIT